MIRNLLSTCLGTKSGEEREPSHPNVRLRTLLQVKDRILSKTPRSEFLPKVYPGFTSMSLGENTVDSQLSGTHGSW